MKMMMMMEETVQSQFTFLVEDSVDNEFNFLISNKAQQIKPEAVLSSKPVVIQDKPIPDMVHKPDPKVEDRKPTPEVKKPEPMTKQKEQPKTAPVEKPKVVTEVMKTEPLIRSEPAI